MKRRYKTNRELIVSQGKEIAVLKKELKETKGHVDFLMVWRQKFADRYEDKLVKKYLKKGKKSEKH